MTTPPEPNPPRRRFRFGGCLFVLSLLGNVVLAAVAVTVAVWPVIPDDPDALTERHYLGSAKATDKVAVVKVTGVLVEGNTAFALRQLSTAAKDKHVKAVVVRIDSPGGTVSASEDVYRAIVDLRDDTGRVAKGSGPKPVVASMGAIAASGGYYVAMPAKTVVAEPICITGSIGVFAALPNLSGLAERNGVEMKLVKAGDIKAGGSMFHKLSPEERQPWQDMVESAYDRFLTVIAAGRPGLTRERMVNDKIRRDVPKYDDKGNVVTGPDGKPVTLSLTRYRADGGTFTPTQAKELGLIDDIADLPAAVKLAAAAAGLSDYQAITYDRPRTPSEILLGMQVSAHFPSGVERLADAATPRLWFLTPGYESAVLANAASP